MSSSLPGLHRRCVSHRSDSGWSFFLCSVLADFKHFPAKFHDTLGKRSDKSLLPVQIRSPLIPVTSAIFARSCACFSVMVYFSEKRNGFKPGLPGCRSVWLPALAAFSKVEQISITAICPAVVSRMAGRDAS